MRNRKLMPDARILAQMCHALVSEATPDTIRILCLKCLGNSCLDSYKHKQHTIDNVESVRYRISLYDKLVESDLCEQGDGCDYPHDSHFPYDGVTEWTVDYIKSRGESTDCSIDSEFDIFRLSIQFLSNLFTYACPDVTSADSVMRSLSCDNLKQAVLSCMQSDRGSLASAACIYVHNALKKLCYNYFADERDLCLQLLKPIKEGFTSATDALLLLLHRPNVFKDVYDNVTTSEKLDLLEIVYNEMQKSWQSDLDAVLTVDQAEFLALIFCRKSDCILKTVDTYVDSVDPMEIILILNILGLFTTQCKIVKDAPLLINCKYLLLSLHMAGKERNNYFTPITNLSQVAPSARGKAADVKASATEASEATAANDPQDHPAYGFKAGLIRVIANIVHENKRCQDLFREIDGIPVLLDCCNIDARNPLILQWTILAVRNLCQGNPQNQEVIRNCKRTGVPGNPVLQEMGLTLHEDTDGNSIRIAPLRRN
ncbi:PREDICTED: ataxin-10 isoform X2 [Vollenhovia emeryi]|uniref:ataxin-10 isoform X2 n=1 Tax=Vollenhovia emeryi TaxID=411798 RepID=UPI0005F54566|nr:PREDICTED: ataxin-10 isoform X2 [Vollenhovia emeryi]